MRKEYFAGKAFEDVLTTEPFPNIADGDGDQAFT
jgi:hypothetical protein